MHEGSTIPWSESSAEPNVLEAARFAWEWHGVPCYVRVNQAGSPGVVGALDLPDRRHVELFIEDEGSITWETVSEWVTSDQWSVRAVVPRAALGHAHEVLREHGCELQSYWLQPDGRVEFGAIEIA